MKKIIFFLLILCIITMLSCEERKNQNLTCYDCKIEFNEKKIELYVGDIKTYTIAFTPNTFSFPISDIIITSSVEGVVKVNIIKSENGLITFTLEGLKSEIIDLYLDIKNSLYSTKTAVTVYSKIRITFITDGDSENPPVQFLEFYQKVTKPKDPVKKGFIFGGWLYVNESFNSASFIYDFNEKVYNSFTLKAFWLVTVSYDSKGGSFIDTDSVGTGYRIYKPRDPSLNSAHFEGWFKDENYSSPFNFEKELVTANIILYAKWSVTVDFYSNNNVIDIITVPYGSKIVPPNNLINPPYTFGGWYDNGFFNTPVINFETQIFKDSYGVFAKWNLNFIELPASQAFKPRLGHTTVVFKDSLWLIGGFDFNSYYNDVWVSLDGINWTEKIGMPSTKFSPRYEHTSLVFNDSIWVIGGIENKNNRKNDVWASVDGINWTEKSAMSISNFSARSEHTSVVFNNEIFIIGGLGNDGTKKNDVWSSNDGVNWTEKSAKSISKFKAVSGHTSIVFNNKIFVIGGLDNDGNSLNDVWFSSDGINWEEISNKNNIFRSRTDLVATTDNNTIWVIGGLRGNIIESGVWSSTKGAYWDENVGFSNFNSRYSHTFVFFKNKLWVIGGKSSKLENKVWRTE